MGRTRSRFVVILSLAAVLILIGHFVPVRSYYGKPIPMKCQMTEKNYRLITGQYHEYQQATSDTTPKTNLLIGYTCVNNQHLDSTLKIHLHLYLW
jgi:hypothetical protein